MIHGTMPIVMVRLRDTRFRAGAVYCCISGPGTDRGRTAFGHVARMRPLNHYDERK